MYTNYEGHVATEEISRGNGCPACGASWQMSRVYDEVVMAHDSDCDYLLWLDRVSVSA